MEFDWDEFEYRLQQKDFDGAERMLPQNVNIVTDDGFGLVDYICRNTNNDGVPLLCRVLKLGATFDVKRCCGYYAVENKSDRNLKALLDFGHPVEGTFVGTGATMSLLEKALLRCVDGPTACLVLLIERGAELRNVNCANLFWAKELVAAREKIREAALAILGLLMCRSRVLGINRKDVLRMIARCVWSTRAVFFSKWWRDEMAARWSERCNLE